MAISASGTSASGSSKAGAAAGRVGNDEYHSAPLPPLQEAAVLYSANFTAAAESLLRAQTRSPATRGNKAAWLMLFDLYEMTQNRAEFDALAMLFTVKFEQSPPAWAEGEAAAPDPRRAQNRDRKDFFTLKPNAMGELEPEIGKLVTFAESMGAVRLDLGKIASITAGESAKLLAALQRLRRAALPMWFNNAGALEKVLREALNERASEATRAFWLLLFELYILQGSTEPFEELGLEYAVAFEISPPNWEVYTNSVTAAAAPRGAALPHPPEAGIALKGVISTASQNQFTELADHAAGLSDVNVDLGKVLRIDFAVCATFYETLKAIQLGGKRIILSNLSELNAALLEAFGFNRHAILIRRKAT